MGLCLGKFHAGGGSGSVLHPVSPNSNGVATPSTAADKTAKAKNHVTPLPASTSASLKDEAALRPPTLQKTGDVGGSSKSIFSSGAPSTLPPAGRMKRSQSLAVRNPDKQLSPGSKNTPFEAAAAAAAATNGASSTIPATSPPENDVKDSPRRHASLRPTLKHRVSERNSDQSMGADGSKQVRRPKKPVTVSLEVLFRDERARLGFFRYLQSTALQEKLREVKEQENDETHMMKRRMSKMTNSRFTIDYREDCVLFWLEMSDLLKIPSGGSFHLGLMQDLFDVYIAKGALRQLPMVSAAEREPLQQFLQDKNAERALLAYKMLLLDVLEVVTTHFDEYVRAEGKLGYSQATKSMSMRNVLARLAKVNIGNTGDRRAHLNEIVSTPALCRIFREFLQERNSVETLLFIIDSLAFEDLVNTFDQEPGLRAAHDGSHHDYCLRQAQKIFNKYIRYGSKAEICLGGAVKEKLLQEIVEYPLGAELFNDAVLVCSAELVHSHLDQFYGTSAYLSYKAALSQARSTKSNRKISTSGAKTILKRHLSDEEAQGNSRGGSTVGSDKKVTIVELGDGNEMLSSGPLLSLTDILNGSGSSYLRDFLKEEGMENMMFFYKEVAEFQLLPHGQKHYIQSKARKIFDKFVRRGGKLEIELPADVRRDILWKLSAPTEHTFADAQKYVFNYWEHNYLDKFRHHQLYGDMMAALQKLPNYGLLGTDSKTSNTHGGGNNGTNGDWVDVTKITLREFLDLEFLRRFFRLFLEKEQCANELYFYFEILNFQQFPTSDYLTRQAKKLFNRFCDPASREFVSLKSESRTYIQNNLNNPSPAMFNKAQDEIVSFFTTTLFPKFQQSEIYRTIRITNIELRLGKLAASGNAGISQVRGRNGMMGDASNGPRPSTSPARMRNSVAPGAFGAGGELSEAQVTVTRILEHPETRALFLFFSEEIFCTESIYFWLDCNEFKDIPHKSYLKLRAQKIYRKYISGTAKLQVNLESMIIKEIVAHLDDPSRTLFVPAQKSITKMLERDTLPKFRRSKHFQPCLQLLRQDAKSTAS
ncbi:hypothetical protein Gpo141_00003994 [Globisporangium polare]